MTQLKNRLLISITLGIVLASCSNAPLIETSIRPCAPMPVPTAAAAATALGDYAYVFGGRTEDGLPNSTLWQYNSITDTWSQTDTPLKARVNAAMCSNGQYIYMGLGFGGRRYTEDSTYYQDFWRYSPDDGQFLQLTDFPSNATDKPVTLCYNEKIYLFFCWKDGFSRDVFVYDISTDTWQTQTYNQRKTDFPPRVFAATGAVCRQQLFLGTGYWRGSRNFWAEWNPNTGEYNKLASLPGKGRHNAACAANSDYVYVLGGWHYGDPDGSGFYHNDILRYSPDDNKWQLCGTMPCGAAHNMIAFSLNQKIYFGLGENPDTQTILNNLYCIEE